MGITLNQSSSKHRKEIDGLRALAVLAVISFHFFPKYFPSGFLGVDIFFVISGYLITSLQQQSLLTNTFSFTTFYLKRIKRILPAVLVMLCVTSAAALIILLASDLQKYAYSQIATLGFLANIYFWRTGGYFSTADELKPLLHMWSLGVEEQFYLFFPCFLLLVSSVFKRKALQIAIVLVVSLSSYFANMYLISIGGANPAFFLLPTRIWQFGLGSFFALLPVLKLRTSLQVNLLFILSISLIIIGLLAPIQHLPIASLLSLGTGMILWNKVDQSSIFLQGLIAKPIQLIGLCSFSLYLWHWPILTFMRYIYVIEVPVVPLLAALTLTFALSYFSWKFIENPFRGSLSTKTTLYMVGALYILLISFSCLVYLFKGFPGRDSPLANSIASAIDSNYRCPTGAYRLYGASRACKIGSEDASPTIALLGNSHAQMYAPAIIDSLIPNHEAGLIIPLNGCIPTTDINISVDCLRMAQINAKALEADKALTSVVLAMTWYSNELVDEQGKQILDSDFSYREKSIMKLIKSLSDAGKNVYLVGPIAIPNFEFASIASRNIKFGNLASPTSIPRQEFDDQFSGLIKSLTLKLGSHLILPHEIFCTQNKCFFGDGEGAFFSDSNHLSLYGVNKIGQLFIDIQAR